MFKRGQTDVGTGAELNEQNSTIIIQAKKLVNDYIADCKGKLNSLKKQLENQEKNWTGRKSYTNKLLKFQKAEKSEYGFLEIGDVYVMDNKIHEKK